MKAKLICPNCGEIAFYNVEKEGYYCDSCKWNSNSSDTADISYKSYETGALSNLFPYKFEIDGVQCASMESFIQSLREENPDIQAKICSDCAGPHAYKLRVCLNDWRTDGFVYWRGKKIKRISEDYTALITRAYDALFEQNILFRRALEHFKYHYLIHSIGKDDNTETLLTEEEYRFQLNRLKNILIQQNIPPLYIL